jgi:hypothetical protein
MTMLWIVITVILVICGYRTASQYERQHGYSPWDLPAWAWGMLWGLGLLIGGLLWLYATRATKPIPASRTAGVRSPSTAPRPLSSSPGRAVAPASPGAALATVPHLSETRHERGRVLTESDKQWLATMPPADHAPAWLADPLGQADQRFWNGTYWTGRLCDEE